MTHTDPFRTVGPMARIGADVAALEDLAGQLGRASDSLRRSASRIDGALARSLDRPLGRPLGRSEQGGEQQQRK